MVGVEVDKATLRKLHKQLDKISLKKQDKALLQILATSSLPIRKAAKAKAKSVVKSNSGFTYTRRGTTYQILPGTIEKSIGAIKLKRAPVPMVDVGYRRKGKYDGWFAHYVDQGTKSGIAPRNIMQTGKIGIGATEIKIKKDVLRLIKRLSK